MKGNIIAGLDIGSTAVRLVVGQKTANEAGEQLQILGAVTVPAEGINRGVVNSIEDATSAISACLEKAERLIGVPLANVWVGINGPNLKCEKSRGVVAVGRMMSTERLKPPRPYPYRRIMRFFMSYRLNSAWIIRKISKIRSA